MTLLEFLRRERGWSQNRLAEAIGWNRYSVSRLCNGYPKMPADVRDKLEALFETPIKRLLEDAEVKE